MRASTIWVRAGVVINYSIREAESNKGESEGPWVSI